MTTSLPSQHEQSSNVASAGEGPDEVLPPQPSGPQPVVLPKQSEPEEQFFCFEEEQPDLESAFVAPFQPSGATPTVTAPVQQSNQVTAASMKKTSRKPRFSLTMIAILICVVVIVGLLVMSALAQTTPPLQTTQQPVGKQQKPAVKSSSILTLAHTNATNEQGQGQAATQTSSDWVPQQLPNGWTNGGLLTGDAIQALRTAVTFTDREMSLDYRSVGTQNNHGGTFTAATFLLTPAAKQRFAQKDVRVINNTLFDMVVTTKLVRLVVNPQPQLVNFMQQGQQQFAWVDVAFQLWQSQIDPNTPQSRVEGKELDPTTHQPRIHHMMVLLLHVPAQNAENNPAMGGTGWLVSNYSLDMPNDTALEIVQPA